ncbi:hypothetical protein FWK35_00017043 [Aphis craccivora]|uniref:Uncharacterized protein n=1 Tax=Aphis craccivora TaxID=307492 RepID=A0A6G0Y579_APHCR|nr:hypothetical protein FWK35_00017043 [Aphis craccivora]
MILKCIDEEIHFVKIFSYNLRKFIVNHCTSCFFFFLLILDKL